MIYNKTDMVFKHNGFEIDGASFLKKDIKSVKVLNIESQFINSENRYEHIVLDDFIQTGVFTTPKFYIVLRIETNKDILTVSISDKPVHYHSNQYLRDKKEAENIYNTIANLKE